MDSGPEGFDRNKIDRATLREFEVRREFGSGRRQCWQRWSGFRVRLVD